MSISTHARVRTGVLSVTTATALAAALAVAPATASPPDLVASPTATRTATVEAPGSTRLVTLVTGDRVLVRTDAAGRTIASLTPRSPHYGGPVEHVNAGGHTWVVPKLATSLRQRLDPSLFDVAALSGRVPLRVTFAPDAAPRRLPGLDVRTATARTSASGRTTVAASYDASRPLPAGFTRSLAGVSSIAVQEASAPVVPPDYNLQTLTINGTTVQGKTLPFADTFVFNLDDGRLFGAFGALFDGQWKVSVPSGHYLVLSNDFVHAVVSQVDVGDTDATVAFSMADASVKPRLTLPDHRQVNPALDLLGRDALGKSSFDIGWSGFLPKVSPAHLTVGSIQTEVANLWAPKGYREFTFHGHHLTINPLKAVAAAKEVVNGVPRHLTFHYRPADFARVAVKHYATGPKQGALDGFFGFSRVDSFAFIQLFPTVRPGIVHAMFQGSRSIFWDSITTLGRSFRSFTQVEQADRYHRGQHAVVPFFRGPVTPVADRGFETDRVRPNCALCVSQGDLIGGMSMVTAAGTQQFGIADHGSWAVVSRRSRLDRGRFAISPVVRNAVPGQTLRLLATTSRANQHVALSTHVSDWWQFRVPSQDAIIPILRASYVPPTNLASVGKPGRIAFPLTFDNLGAVDARVTRASVRWSVDGRTWHSAHLTRTDANTFRVAYANPSATRSHRTLSLRITGQDAGGRRMSEEVRDAYFLPKSGSAGAAHPAGTTHPAAAAHVNRFVPNKLCRTTTKSQYSCFVRMSRATRTSGRGAPDPAGWGAPVLRQAYGLGSDPARSTVAVIVAFDYPHAEADMNRYRAQFGLPACTSASGCFTKLNQRGQTASYPPQDFGWGLEAALDLQMISAACPTCRVVLVEANEPTDKALGRAEQAAVDAGATVTNHSYGRIELTGTDTLAARYDHPGVTAVAATGDFGYAPASFPASSPSVVAVGGTTLSRSTTDPRGWTEKAWRFAGSGCSAYFGKVVGQTDPACHMRTASDVSAVARGLAVFDTSLPRRFRGWLEVDGTSASSPLVSGMIGSAGRGGLRPADLYAGPADAFNDVTSGSNGFCRGSYLCTGVPGYDGPTGLGTPKGVASFGLPPT